MKIVEKISPVDRTPHSIMLINAMTRSVGRGDLLEHFKIVREDGKNVEVDVELLINGVHVDVKKTLDEMWERLVSKYHEDVLEKSKELLSQSRLNKLDELIRDAEWKIEEELNKLFPEE
jgi:hypothetical protein